MFSLQYYILLKHLQIILSIKATGKLVNISARYRAVVSLCLTVAMLSPVKTFLYFIPASSYGMTITESFHTSLPKGSHSGCWVSLVKNLGATTSAMEFPNFLENEQMLFALSPFTSSGEYSPFSNVVLLFFR